MAFNVHTDGKDLSEGSKQPCLPSTALVARLASSFDVTRAFFILLIGSLELGEEVFVNVITGSYVYT